MVLVIASTACDARIVYEVSSRKENMIRKSKIQRYILSAVIALTNFLPFFLPRSYHRKLEDLFIGLTIKRHEVTKRV